jgi:hypothetical protein
VACSGHEIQREASPWLKAIEEKHAYNSDKWLGKKMMLVVKVGKLSKQAETATSTKNQGP